MQSISISTPVPLVKNDEGKWRFPRITWEFHEARLDLQIPIGRTVQALKCVGVPIDVARNNVVKKALELDNQYLFFLDWDVIVPAVALTRLIYLADNYPEYDVFSGLYCTKSNPPHPLIWKSLTQEGIDYDWTVGELLEPMGVPAGCMLLRMSLFKNLPYTEETPWFKTIENLCTEDLYFCKRLHEETKSRILLDTGIQCGHIDWETGTMYCLPSDALPWRRWKEKYEVQENARDSLQKRVRGVTTAGPLTRECLENCDGNGEAKVTHETGEEVA